MSYTAGTITAATLLAKTSEHVQDQLTPVGHAKSHEQAPEMSAHGRHRYVKLFGDLFVGSAAQQPLHNLRLAAREAQAVMKVRPFRL